MTYQLLIVIVSLSLLIGIIYIKKYYSLKKEFSNILQKLNSINELNLTLNNENSILKNKIDSATEVNNSLLESKDKEISLLKDETDLLKNQIEFLSISKDALKKEFSALANEVIEEKNKNLSKLGDEALSSVLEPVQNALKSFSERIETVHKEDIEGRASLETELKIIRELNNKLSTEANELTKALKGDSKLQGNWGEMILEKLLTSTGLKEGREYFREKNFSTSDGNLRPDVILNMPNNKHIVIDSKVSLVAYEQAINAEGDTSYDDLIKKHLLSLKTHIDTLATKRYDHLDGLNSLDFTLMFIPIEGAYLLAIEKDPSLFERAFEKRIAVVTPTTLFTTLKTIEQLWRYERQTENSAQLIKRAGEVHDRIVGFIETFEKIGKQLELAQKSYEDGYNKLRMGRGNLVRQAEMLKDISGKTKKDIPEHLLETSDGVKLIDFDKN